MYLGKVKIAKYVVLFLIMVCSCHMWCENISTASHFGLWFLGLVLYPEDLLVSIMFCCPHICDPLYIISFEATSACYTWFHHPLNSVAWLSYSCKLLASIQHLMDCILLSSYIYSPSLFCILTKPQVANPCQTLLYSLLISALSCILEGPLLPTLPGLRFVLSHFCPANIQLPLLFSFQLLHSSLWTNGCGSLNSLTKLCEILWFPILCQSPPVASPTKKLITFSCKQFKSNCSWQRRGADTLGTEAQNFTTKFRELTLVRSSSLHPETD